MKRSIISGIGAALPARIMPNSEFTNTLDTSDEWIQSRTGIKSRHIAGEGEFTSHLATRAATEALARSGVAASDISLVIVATTTPDDTMPATATKVQHAIGATHAAAFDLNAACSGFVYALHVANALIVAGQAQHILVVGAETYSRIVDWNDRGTCILFGDGAGAVVLSAHEGKGDTNDRGIIWSKIFSDGAHTEWLRTSGGVSTTGKAGLLSMAGKEIYKNAVTKMPEAVEEGMKALALPLEAIDWVVPHQANIRILQAVGERLGLPESKLIATVDHHANTSAASIPLALYEAQKEGKIKQNQLIVCPALGAGLTGRGDFAVLIAEALEFPPEIV